MAVTASVTLARVLAEDAPRPAGGAPDGSGHMGWSNPVGDPHYNADIDWYRRVVLSLTGSAGEYINIVNWELFDGTVPMKATTDLDSGAAYTGTTASPFGSLVNNTTTWTVWASNGLATADTVKYYDTGKAPVSTLRANGSRTIVLLGNPKKVGDAATTWSCYAFTPDGPSTPYGDGRIGAFKTPVASTTVVVENVSYDAATGVTMVSAPWTGAIGALANLGATVAPAGASQSLVWTSQNTAVVTVNRTTGAAQITGAGTTTVTATSATDPTVSATLAVTGTAVRAAEAETAPEAEPKKKGGKK